jgi:hypothetical protein
VPLNQFTPNFYFCLYLYNKNYSTANILKSEFDCGI